MKITFSLILGILFCLYSSAQTKILLNISPRLGNEIFALNQAVDHPGGKYQLKINRFEYYLSDLRIIHDGGQEKAIQDYYILVNPSNDSIYNLGVIDGIENIEAIRFSVGVDPEKNHLDPATYVTGHPLALKDPSMHWGWASGYRFAAIEGIAGASLNQVFEIHALGDENYKTCTIQTQANEIESGIKMIQITADYSQVFTNLNLSRGLIVHGATGVAVTLMNNFESLVFKSSGVSSQKDELLNVEFQLNPNPVRGNLATLELDLPYGHTYQVRVEDLYGKTISQRIITPGDLQNIQMELGSAGIYLVKLYSNEKILLTRKLVRIN